MADASYIKKNAPSTYAFFVEYWDFVKKFWCPTEDSSWWDVFISDLAYYFSKYEYNDFFVDLIMQVYVRNQDSHNRTGTIEELREFLGEWWRYINTYYAPEDEDADWWDRFIVETKELSHRYGKNEFYSNLIDIFVRYKTAKE